MEFHRRPQCQGSHAAPRPPHVHFGTPARSSHGSWPRRELSSLRLTCLAVLAPACSWVLCQENCLTTLRPGSSPQYQNRGRTWRASVPTLRKKCAIAKHCIQSPRLVPSARRFLI
eukprot:9498532-Pyramimonas_sp.AAC.1